MDDEDYRALIAVVAEEMRASGATGLADERNYSWIDESGETRLLEPQRRLIEMLESFDRFLSIQDRATYERALSSISRSLDGNGPRHVTVTLATEDTPREFDLSETPNLKQVRDDLRQLILHLSDGDFRPTGGAPD